MSLHVTGTLIRALKNVCLAKNENRKTHILNGSNQRTHHMQWHQWLHQLIALALSFQNHHHLSLYLSVGPSTHHCREARWRQCKCRPNVVLEHRKAIRVRTILDWNPMHFLPCFENIQPQGRSVSWCNEEPVFEAPLVCTLHASAGYYNSWNEYVFDVIS